MAGSRKIGPYLLLDRIGEGGMGEVHRVRRESAQGFDKTFALKIIRGDPASIAARRDAFLHEARVCARLAHPNIVHAVDFGIDGDVMYLVMEDVEGVNLRDVLETLRASGERVSPLASLGIATEVLKGLDHAHRRADDAGRPLGLVHRDLTPNNILISRDGAVKIADFGVAKSALAPARSAPGELKGKFHYMSPEQIAGAPIDARSDLFSLGVVLFEMWTGRRPFEGANVSEVMAAISRCDRDAPTCDEIPDEVAAALRRLLAHVPNERFADAGDALRAFEDLLAASGGVAAREIRELVGRVAPPAVPRARSANQATRTGRLVRRETPEAVQPQAAESAPRESRAPARHFRAVAVVAVFAALVAAIFVFGRGSRDRAADAAPGNAERPLGAATPAPEPSAPGNAERPLGAADANPSFVLSPSPTPTPSPTPSPTPKPTPSPTPTVAPVVESEPIAPPPSAEPGFLRVGDLVPYAEVVIDGRSVDTTPTPRISLAPGTHRLLLKNDQTGQREVREIVIVSGETLTITAWGP